MIKHTRIFALILGTVLAVLGASTGNAHATEASRGSIGVGGELGLALLGGPSMNYDAGEFHVGGFLFFSDDEGDENTDFGLGARFYYHLHDTAQSDFGVGGALSMGFFDNGPMDDDDTTEVHLEPGIQFRAFIVSNVALSFTGGIRIGLVDAGGFDFTAQPSVLGGVHYYFF